MAIVLNDIVTSDKTMEALPLQNVPEPLSSSGLEELPDEIQVLPFVEDDPCGEFGWRQGCVRDYATGKSDCVQRFLSNLMLYRPVNRVAVECWKALRIPQTPKKPEPQDLSLFPQMPIDILLEVRRRQVPRFIWRLYKSLGSRTPASNRPYARCACE
jgi:hypothetical protein